jgi:hypothetical protein
VNLVRVFGREEIFTDNALNLALRPLATRRLNVTNLHIKTKSEKCRLADVPDIQDPSTNMTFQCHIHHYPKTPFLKIRMHAESFIPHQNKNVSGHNLKKQGVHNNDVNMIKAKCLEILKKN